VLARILNSAEFWVAVRVRAVTLAVLVFSAIALAGQTETPSQTTSAADPQTFFAHSDTSLYWISGQSNVIAQWHPSFPAKYSGVNSLRPEAEHAISSVETLHLGLAATHTTELFIDIETANGGGISDAFGLAGYTNLDVVRNPTLGPKPYLARGLVRQIIPLSDTMVETERAPYYMATQVPERRIELRFGKMGTNEYMDLNDVGSDSHYQFLNWTVDNAGTYDYAADTRGYSVGLLAEYHDRGWAFRFSEMLMPKVANGIDLVWNLHRARAENMELELHPVLITKRGTAIRLLSFINHANMGVYKQAIADFLAGKTPRPEITAHPLQTTIKYGFGVNLQQEVTSHLRVFARWGWNEGQHESYAYTEVDQTLQLGADYGGSQWKRKSDKIGAVFVSNGISADHQRYLALGGQGFLLGDGALNYGRENIFETYYTAHIWRGLSAGFDLQHINNPGYNRDRGPVLVPGVRVHLEF
jgi:high affinity Mn2+ porin